MSLVDQIGDVVGFAEIRRERDDGGSGRLRGEEDEAAEAIVGPVLTEEEASDGDQNEEGDLEESRASEEVASGEELLHLSSGSNMHVITNSGSLSLGVSEPVTKPLHLLS